MNTLTIGRFGTDVPVTEEGVTVQRAGDKVSFRGRLIAREVAGQTVAYTQEELQALAQQLLGHLGADESVLPVTSTGDGALNGYYRLLAATTGIEDGSYGGAGIPWTASLERIPNYQTALHEATLIADVKENAHSITTASMWHAAPAGAVYDLSTVSAAETIATRTGPGGSVDFVEHSITQGEFAYPTFDPGISGHYTMASSARVVVGDSTAAVTDGQINAVGKSLYTLDNGLVKVRVQNANVSPLSDLEFHMYGNNGSAYSTAPYPFELGWWDGAAFVEFVDGHGWQVIYNSPERVILRQLLVGVSGSSSWDAAVNMVLRRGSHLVEFNFESRFALKWAINFAAPAGTWSSSVSGRVTGTNDAESNRWAMFCTAAFTASSGLIYRDTASRLGFFSIGMIRAGSGAAAPNRGQDLRDQFFCSIGSFETVGQ